MGNLFLIINAYYDTFESYKPILRFNNLVLWLLSFLFGLFLYSFYWYVSLTAFPNFPEINRTIRLIIVIFFEILVLMCWFTLMKMQEKRIIKKAQCLLQTTENSIPKLKKLWFKAAIGTDSTQYLEVAEKIDKIIKIKEINQSNFKFGSKELGNLIFQTESKNRILAMFMGCFAAVVALSIKSGATIDDLISFYSDAPFLTLLFLDFLLSIFLLLAILITKLAFLFIFDLFSSWSDSLNKQKAISPRRAKIFINQLLYFYDLPKGKFKIKTGFISIK